jgi:hypothetical protein
MIAICVVYPPVETHHRLAKLLPRRVRKGEFHVVEAWPGSVVVEKQGKGYPDLMHGYILDIAGDDPAGLIGSVYMVLADEVEDMRAKYGAMMKKLRERIEDEGRGGAPR